MSSQSRIVTRPFRCLRKEGIKARHALDLDGDLPGAAPEVQAALLSSAPSGRREDVIAHDLATGRLWQSPGWPFDDAERAAMIGRCWDRCYCPEGVARQYRAIEMSTPDFARIEKIATPMLVIHGLQDTLLPLAEHGQRYRAARSGRAPGRDRGHGA
jgi:pimeloyl-ACP methyl ester carboxylesterase